MNVETLLVDWLNHDAWLAHEGVETFLEVPEDRPNRFITVERTGGNEDIIRGFPTLAVQTWSEHRHDAGNLAHQAALAVRSMVRHPLVAKATVAGLYSFPDPASAQPRYQLTVELVVVHD
ncbi:MAG: hypothetical protein ACTII7_07785 [Galactobacter sp.]